MKRRNFIKLASTASAIGLMPFEVNAMLKPLANLNACDFGNRKLILINLSGGNDGLNTLVPVNQYDLYSNLRPTIKLSNSGANAYIPLDTSLNDDQLLGLHPSMTGFKSLYDQGWMRVIQSVGYPSQNKSHFASKDIYMTGNDGNSMQNGNDSGWIGRFMERYYAGETQENYPLGVQIGSFKTSLGFHGITEHGLSLNLTGQDPAGFYSVLNGLGGVPPSSTPNSHYGTELNYIIDIDKLSNRYAQSISNAFNAGSNNVTYPDTDIADQLKTVAKLISGGLDSKIYMVRLDGFDTHNNQAQGGGDILGRHNTLLTKLSEAVSAFFNDINASSIADDIVGLTYSEFGRKAKENGNLGTDHGEIAPMFVFGKPVNGGVSGINPDLSEASSSNNYQIKTVQHDYRQTIGTLLQDFLGAENTTIDSSFFNATSNSSFTDAKIDELLKDSYTVPDSCYTETLSDNDFFDESSYPAWQAYPNPFQSILQLRCDEDASLVQYKILNVSGQLVLQDRVNATDGYCSLQLGQLRPGTYILHISSDVTEGNEVHKVIKL